MATSIGRKHNIRATSMSNIPASILSSVRAELDSTAAEYTQWLVEYNQAREAFYQKRRLLREIIERLRQATKA